MESAKGSVAVRKLYSLPTENSGGIVREAVAELTRTVESILKCENGEILSRSEESLVSDIASRGYSHTKFPSIYDLTRSIVDGSR